MILTGLMRDQVATRTWDLPYLREKLADRPVQVVTHDQPRLYWDPSAGLPERPVLFQEFADRAFERPTGRYSYLQDDVNSFPVLKQDYRLPEMVADRGIKRSKLWLSGAGLITPLHYDGVETLHWVIRGRKRFVCYRPGVGRYYPYSITSTAPFISRVDPDHPEPARFPRFARARPQEFFLEEGEVLYLPAFWWHQVRSDSRVNLSLNFVWFASLGRCARHLPQFARTARHLVKRLTEVRARRRAASAELGTPT